MKKNAKKAGFFFILWYLIFRVLRKRTTGYLDSWIFMLVKVGKWGTLVGRFLNFHKIVIIKFI